MPQVIVDLSANERKLLQAYKEAVSADKGLRDSIDKTGKEGKEAGKEIAEGMISGAKKAAKGLKEEFQGGFSGEAKKEMNSLLRILRDMGPEGKASAEELRRHMNRAGREGVESIDDVIDKIGMIDEAAADSVRGARSEFKKLDDDQEKTAGEPGLKKIAKWGAAWAAAAGSIDLIREAMERVRATNERALSALEGTAAGDKRLLQVSNSAEDFQALSGRADDLAKSEGISRDEARNLMFSARSEGFEGSTDFIASNSQVLDIESQATVAGQIPGLFTKETLTPEEAINMTLAGAAESRLDFGEIARALPSAAEGGSLAGASSEETVATLSVLASRFKSGDTAADRMKGLSTKFGLDDRFKGGGILDNVEKLQGMSEKERSEFLGGSQEANAAYEMIVDEMSTIRDREKIIGQARQATGTDQSITSQKRAAAAEDEGLATLKKLNRSEIRKEIAEEENRAVEEGSRQTRKNDALSGAENRGESKLKIAGVEMFSNKVSDYGFEEEAVNALPVLLGDELAKTSVAAGEALKTGRITGSEFYQSKELQAFNLAATKLQSRRGEDENAMLTTGDVQAYYATAGQDVSPDQITPQMRAALTREILEASQDFENRGWLSDSRSTVGRLSGEVAEEMLKTLQRIEKATGEGSKASQQTATNTKPRGVNPNSALQAAGGRK